MKNNSNIYFIALTLLTLLGCGSGNSGTETVTTDSPLTWNQITISRSNCMDYEDTILMDTGELTYSLIPEEPITYERFTATLTDAELENINDLIFAAHLDEQNDFGDVSDCDNGPIFILATNEETFQVHVAADVDLSTTAPELAALADALDVLVNAYEPTDGSQIDPVPTLTFGN